jgi:hypothetical protein
MVEKRDAERAIIDEAMEKIFKNVRVEISDILDEHFQEADRFICPINLCLPEDPVVINSPEIKVKKRFFFERTALVDYIARHGYICPKTRITFESKNIQTSLEFYPTIGKMCHKILKEAQRVSRCSLRQLRCLEVMRCICQKQCDTKFLKNRKEVVDKRNANRIGDKSYYGRMSNLMGKFDPSIDDVNSDEEKE